MKKILFIGETWVKNITHIKGYDTFVTCHFEDCSNFLRDAVESYGYEVEHIAAHMVGQSFPKSPEDLAKYDAIILSDIGSNSFYLTNHVFLEGKPQINYIQMMKDFVLSGGGLLMVGGYMSFTGIDAKARFKNTPLNDVLPIEMLDYDDRIENSSGIIPKTTSKDHPIMSGIDEAWKPFLGYNKLQAKKSCPVIATIGEDDVFIAAGEFGKGRSAAFASDCATHWGTVEFMEWKHYNTVWGNIIDWITKSK